MEYISAKTIITRNKISPYWFDCEYNMNIYKGCCHGCIYCDSRSECYRIDDFDRIRAKENCLELIRNELRRKVKSGVVAMGAMSDPYNPFEKELELTRHALELISAYGFGAAAATKSDLIARDCDIFSEISEHSPVLAKITITCADNGLSKLIEPNAPPSSRRFEALARLAERGVFCGVLLMPILPFINDSEENVLNIARRAKECGAKFVYPSFGVTLRQNQREYFFDKLREIFPNDNYVRRYVSSFGSSYFCSSPNAKRLYASFSEECRRLGLAYDIKEINRLYRQVYTDKQTSLF